MILITGATGGLGKETINALLKKIPTSQIVALARSREKAVELEEKGIEVRIGDYADYNSLVAAFKGIDKVLAISTAVLSEDRIAQEKNVINAALQSGVRHVLYTSIQRREDRQWVIPYVTEGNTIIESHLKNSGLTYTILKNTLYFDTLPGLLGDDVIEAGVQFPAGNGKVAFATRKDLGEGIATLLTRDDFDNREVTLSNSEAWTFAEIAQQLTALAGKSIPYNDIDKNAYISHKSGLGFPEVVAAFFADWADASKEGEFAETDPTLEKLLGRKPTDAKTFLQEAFFSN